MNAKDVKEALARRHPRPQWVTIEEALSGWSSWCGGIDLLALGVWRSAKAPGLPRSGERIAPTKHRGAVDCRNPIVAYEVKVDRADFRREIDGYQPKKTWTKSGRYVRSRPPWPAKQRHALEVSHYFLFATPAHLLRPEEVERREPWGDDAPRPGALWLPPEAGLIEVGGDGRCRVRVPAPSPRRNPVPLTAHEYAELLRRVEYLSLAVGSDASEEKAA